MSLSYIFSVGQIQGELSLSVFFTSQILLQLWIKSGCNLLFSGFWKIILDILSPNENLEGMTGLLLQTQIGSVEQDVQGKDLATLLARDVTASESYHSCPASLSGKLQIQ